MEAQMSTAPARGDLDEFATFASAAYERLVKPKLQPEDHGKFVAIDVDTGDFEIDEKDVNAALRLRARRPTARAWLERVGYPTAYVIGARR